VSADLFAPNPAVPDAGFVFGILTATFVSAILPILIGALKRRPALGCVGGACAGGTAFLCGCLGGLPISLVFVVLILVFAGEATPPRRYDNSPAPFDDDTNPPHG
jgi:hypothetical protein